MAAQRIGQAVKRTGWVLTILLVIGASGCKKFSSPGDQNAAGGASGQQGASSAGSGGAAASGSLADRLKAVQNEGGADKPAPIMLPDWKPVSSATSQMTIPLVKGLVEERVITDRLGDSETVSTVKDVSSQTVTYEFTEDIGVKQPAGGANKNAPPANAPPKKRESATRLIDVADLATSHRWTMYFQVGKTEHIPGSEPMGASAEVINQLRAGQAAQLDMQTDPRTTLSQQFKGHAQLIEVQTNWNGHFMYKCTLQRVGTTDVSFPVMVNGVRTELPAIHAFCPQGGDDVAHLYFLDQPSNGLILYTQITSLDEKSQTTELDFPVNAPGGGGNGAEGMEQALAGKQKVEVYGIYFDFNSATIKPESEAVLKQISDILHKNPSWKLSVAGHTDNIGDAAFNQGLSERRAAAVKNALVTEYKIGTDRLTTSGYGASQPIEDNKTVEGRARNRRVELQRE